MSTVTRHMRASLAGASAELDLKFVGEVAALQLAADVSEIAIGSGANLSVTAVDDIAFARGAAMECASHFDVMHVDELIDAELYARGNDLLERIVAMLTKLIDP